MSGDPVLHAVATTVAVHRIEGWCPTDDHVDALGAVARGDLPFADFLATHRARHPPPARHRRRIRLRRPAPYLVPGTTLLRNEFGVTTTEALADLEYVASAGRMVGWLCAPTVGTLDARAMHRHLFSDTYGWAGQYRIVELRRGRDVFGSVSSIEDRMADVHRTARRLVDERADHDAPRLAYELARWYAEYNQIHPFREGNGRTGALMLLAIASMCGRRLDLTGITRQEWYAAAADSMPARREGRVSYRPFLYLLNRAVR
ncbi:MAG: Fic family protein [Mycolicibacterium rufum]|uniref:protein adenylyltransferase n=1 Tax=Mycolicibacterium chlorophenolicum TaxID=37916 RepID=A0A0J6YAX2_9MYCO|nr:Fic family protein [Mycolicibacterium chlorophenolicum]KMO70006.1 putative adenosine monophosphate-protein transferase fic [Mycolicibacterium chlorophenolicum]MBI5338970.1 Fic family protein [Mycolicibacterium rufum]